MPVAVPRRGEGSSRRRDGRTDGGAPGRSRAACAEDRGHPNPRPPGDPARTAALQLRAASGLAHGWLWLDLGPVHQCLQDISGPAPGGLQLGFISWAVLAPAH